MDCTDGRRYRIDKEENLPMRDLVIGFCPASKRIVTDTMTHGSREEKNGIGLDATCGEPFIPCCQQQLDHHHGIWTELYRDIHCRGNRGASRRDY